MKFFSNALQFILSGRALVSALLLSSAFTTPVSATNTRRDVTGKIQGNRPPRSLVLLDKDPEGRCELEDWCQPEVLSRYLETGAASVSIDAYLLARECAVAAIAGEINGVNAGALILLHIQRAWGCEPIEKLKSVVHLYEKHLRANKIRYLAHYVEVLFYNREITRIYHDKEINKQKKLKLWSVIKAYDDLIKSLRVTFKFSDKSINDIKQKIVDLNSKRKKSLGLICDMEASTYRIEKKIRGKKDYTKEKEWLNQNLINFQKLTTRLKFTDAYRFSIYKSLRLFNLHEKNNEAVDLAKEMLRMRDAFSYDEIFSLLNVFRKARMTDEEKEILFSRTEDLISDPWWYRELVYLLLENSDGVGLVVAKAAETKVDDKFQIADAYIEAYSAFGNMSKAIDFVKDIIENNRLNRKEVLYIKTLLLVNLENRSLNSEQKEYASQLKDELIWKFGWEFEKMWDDIAVKKNKSTKGIYLDSIRTEVVIGAFLTTLFLSVLGFYYTPRNRKRPPKKFVKPIVAVNLKKYKTLLEPQSISTSQPAEKKESTTYINSAAASESQALAASQGVRVPSKPIEKAAQLEEVEARAPEPVPLLVENGISEIEWGEGIPTYNEENDKLFIKVERYCDIVPSIPTFMIVDEDVLQETADEGYSSRLLAKLSEGIIYSDDSKDLVQRSYNHETSTKELQYQIRIRLEGPHDIGWFARALHKYNKNGKKEATLWIFDLARSHKAEKREMKDHTGVGTLIPKKANKSVAPRPGQRLSTNVR